MKDKDQDLRFEAHERRKAEAWQEAMEKRKVFFRGLELGKQDFEEKRGFLGNERSLSYKLESYFFRGYNAGYYAHSYLLRIVLDKLGRHDR